jgi:hypothetical protein
MDYLRKLTGGCIFLPRYNGKIILIPTLALTKATTEALDFLESYSKIQAPISSEVYNCHNDKIKEHILSITVLRSSIKLY